MKLKRIITVVALLNITLLGLYTKNYNGVFENWVNNSLGGVFYVMFFCCLIYFLKPSFNRYKNIIVVFVATCLIELSQLSDFYILESIRESYVGRLILGNTFVPEDFLWYFVGALLSIPFLWFIEYIGNRLLVKE